MPLVAIFAGSSPGLTGPVGKAGDWFAAEMTLRGTHTGPPELGPGAVAPPTGKRIEVSGCWISRVNGSSSATMTGGPGEGTRDTDGVQLGSRSFSPTEARPLLDPRVLIGRSVHSRDEAVRALGEGAGTSFPTGA